MMTTTTPKYLIKECKRNILFCCRLVGCWFCLFLFFFCFLFFFFFLSVSCCSNEYLFYTQSNANVFHRKSLISLVASEYLWIVRWSNLHFGPHSHSMSNQKNGLMICCAIPHGMMESLNAIKRWKKSQFNVSYLPISIPSPLRPEEVFRGTSK